MANRSAIFGVWLSPRSCGADRSICHLTKFGFGANRNVGTIFLGCMAATKRGARPPRASREE
jgi:hypothetical protein